MGAQMALDLEIIIRRQMNCKVGLDVMTMAFIRPGILWDDSVFEYSGAVCQADNDPRVLPLGHVAYPNQ